MPVELTIVESVTELETTVVTVVLESASAPGPAGPGVPTGGTDGQVLTKASATDYDTAWEDPTGGGGGDLDDLDDVTITTPQEGDRLEYNAGVWVNTAAAPVEDHAASHEDGGTDEIDVTGLSGLLADAQTPLSHNHAGEDITSGTVADARIASTIARDSEVTSAISTSEAGQVRDGDTAGGVLSGTYPNPGFAADMATQAELDAHLNDSSDAHDASAISADSTTLVGTGTDVQAVLEELDNSIADHLADSSDAHDASAISFSAVGSIAGTDVQTAVAEVATDAASALSTHESDTTSVHGIADTSALALTANHPSNATFNDHSARHENGGADEISVAGLSGQLADAQLITVRKNTGADVGTRSRLNFIEGSNVTLTVTDDSGSGEVDITVASSGGSGTDLGFANHFMLMGA